MKFNAIAMLPAMSLAVLFAAASQPRVHAITITMEYTDEGDDPPHPENPTWDPDGTILKNHFNAAKAIWEALIPGGGEYTFDFHWDDNLDPGQLAQTTDTTADTFIEVNPNQLWFADATPLLDEEFSPPTQRLYSGLSTADQLFYFPDAAPPGALEVNYQKLGIFHGTLKPDGTTANTDSLSLQMTVDSLGNSVPVDASNGNDLLSTIIHELGHVLGIAGTEPGDYNIDPQHIGGLNNVTVLEGGGGHLGGGQVPPPATNIVPGFLMCNSCGVAGLRRFATATDVLVIAEDQGITVVQLARVGSISSGVWSTNSNWVGGDMPDAMQDVYITHGGVITVDIGAQANNMLVAPGNALAIQAGQSSRVNGVLTFTGGALTVGPDAWLAANALIGSPGSIASAAGSLVRFNQLTETAATSANFGGSVAIGFDTDPTGLVSPFTTTVNPSSSTWNIAENLIVGDENFANLFVDNGTLIVDGNVEVGNDVTGTGGGYGGNVIIQNNAAMTVGGNLTVEGPGSALVVEGTAMLNIAGNVTIGNTSQVAYRDNRKANYITYSVEGGQTVPYESTLLRYSGGSLTFEDTASAGDATVIVEGGAGDDAPGATVVFKDDSSAGDALPLAEALFRTKGGHFGPSASGSMQGNGGQVRFEGTSGGNHATFINEGAQDSTPVFASVGGTGGRTIFTANSNAEHATIHNHGATNVFVLGRPLGGATHFRDFSTAGTADIFNHADATYLYAGMEAKTVFYDSSDAGNATIENEGVAAGGYLPGQTEFRGNSSAALSNIHNRGHLTIGGSAGRTLFYDSATAGDATIHTYEGVSDMGRVEFFNQSTAARARIIVENVPSVPGNGGGYVYFRDNSTAAQSQIFLRAGTCCFGGVQFFNNARAADVQVLTEDGSGNIAFLGTSTAGDPVGAPTAAEALFSRGRGSVMGFYDQSKAEDANISLAYGAQLQFQNNSSAGQANIVAAGSALNPWNGGAVTFNSSSTINNATLTLHGAIVPLGSGASALFNNGAHAGNATITAHGGTGGGGGATITFINSYGDMAQIIANTGSTVDILIQPTFNNGSITLGSIQGAGKVVLRGSHLITGSLNTSATILGPIADNPNNNPFYSGGRLTKVGIGTLTLAGANTYNGLTKVNGGTLSVTGSIAGPAEVNSGGTLNGTGTIGGTVMVNSGGVLAPGTSAGTMTVGALTMAAGSLLQFELGNPLRDHIVLTGGGSVTLGGTLNVLLLDGFAPTLGQSFPLVEGSVGSVNGAFSTVNVPVFNGLTLQVVQSASAVSLQVVGSPFAAGDFDHDGLVDGDDLPNWRGGFGAAGGAIHGQGDGDGDGDVDGRDFLIWQRQLGGGPGSVPASGGVPEPATRVLLVGAALGMLVALRRRAAPCAAAALVLAASAPAAADYAIQDNVAFNARKINPYTGGPAWEFSDTYTLLDESFGPVTIGPLNADPLGLAVEALFGVDLPHVVKLRTGASLSGDANVNFGYYVTAGRLDISYPATANVNFQTAPGTSNVVFANQTYGVGGTFLPGVSQRSVSPQFLTTQGGAGYFTAPLRSQTDYQTPWFETQSPWASAWVEASANVQSSMFTEVSALGGLKKWRKDIRAGGNVGGRLVEIDPTGLYLLGDDEPQVGFDLTQPIGPIPIGGGAADLTIRVPNIAVSSVTNGSVQGSVIRARKEQPLVTLTGNLERLIPFVGTILQNNIGPLGYDLLNLAGGPQLTLYQDMTFTPDPKVRLTFSEPVMVPGNDTPTLQAEFDLDQAFNWKPMFSNSNTIQVTPTYLLNNTFRNETGLNLDLVIDVEALSLTGDFPPFNGTLGPAYAEQVTIPIFEGGALFAPEFDIPLGSVTGGSLPGLGPITTGAITFQKSNLDLVVGLGDIKLSSSDFIGFDQANPGYEIYDLKFTRAVAGGAPRQYQATASGLFDRVYPEGADDEENAAYFMTLGDVVVTDPVTSQPINLGRNFILESDDLSAFLPAPSPAYIDPNPNLGSLYVTTLPDDLSFVPNVDVNVAGHQVLDRYNAGDDVNPPQDSYLPEPTEFVDRAAYPDSTILARKGQVIPDGIGRFNGFNSVTMNEPGDIAYSSSLTLVPSGAGVNGFYFLGASGVTKLARAGDPIPGATGTMTFFGGPVALNDVGQAALLLGMSNSFSNSLVVRNGAGGLKVLARNGQTAPGGGTFQDFVHPALNNSGQVLFWGRVVMPSVGTDEVLYVSDGAALSEIAREGDPAPGMPGLMSSFGYYSLNNSGQASFDVYTTGNAQGLYVRDPNGTLHLIAADGGAVPQGGEFAGINDQALNDAGQVAFAAGLRTSPGGPFKYGLFRGDATSLVQIAREGQLAPDGDGTLKNTGLFSFQVNDSGKVVFRGSIDAATDYQAILVGDGGNLMQVARHGTPAPDGNGQITLLSGVPQLNNHGHVAFDGVIDDPEDEGRSVFLYDGVNILQVVRVGQPMAGSTVVGADAAGINDDMQVAYRASLVDGRSVVARFEPSIYWSKTVSGNWVVANNWSLGIEPLSPYDVFIVAENDLTVAGPAANRVVKSLTLGGENSASARLHLASGVTLTAINGTAIRPNGELTGHGTLAGSVVNGGLVSPGTSPGTLQIDGDFTQTSSGALHIELASATNRDRLFVYGDVTLDGTLTVSLLDGFMPALGQSFTLFEGSISSITGAFDAVNAPLFNGLTLNVVQTAGAVMLQAAPFVPGDFNHDGTVNGADLANWKGGFGVSTGATHTQGDANVDGDVDGGDFLVWQRQLGSPTTVAANAAVPEPAPLLLLVSGVLAMFSTTRHSAVYS